MNLRNMLDVVNEAFAPIDVESSHITSVAYINDQLYVTFYNGSIYEYDDVSEDEANAMMDASSKGKFMWRNIRTTKPYRQVSEIPDIEPEETSVPVVSTQDVEVPKGYQFRAPDGDTYIWHGAQWGNTRTGRIATRVVRDKITDVAKRLIKLQRGGTQPQQDTSVDQQM